jgi:hypothetical protein
MRKKVSHSKKKVTAVNVVVMKKSGRIRELVREELKPMRKKVSYDIEERKNLKLIPTKHVCSQSVCFIFSTLCELVWLHRENESTLVLYH